MEEQWFHTAGSLARDGWQTVVDERLPGWQYTGLRIADLAEGDELDLPDGDVEQLIVPLAGGFTVKHASDDVEQLTRLQGRRSVFAGPTDVLYLGTGTRATLRGRGRVAVATAPTLDHHPVAYIAAEQTSVELRGAGSCSRQVHNFGTPDALTAARLIVCEVITPGSNWSSYPPHKHDQESPGHETQLEEIYYFEAAPEQGSPAAPESAFGLFSTYSSPAGQIEIDAQVHTGDVALVPYGYHGPAAAAPGYDLYYLNVMAGPGSERAWLISDDPAYGWVRGGWDTQPIDPRLPFGPRNHP